MEEKIIIKNKRYEPKQAILGVWIMMGAIILNSAFWWCNDEEIIGVVLVSLTVGGIVSALLYLLMSSIEIVVTSKRVYGKTNLGNSVDLPMDSISSVGSTWFNGIFVATSSGRIFFLFVKNAEEIHSAIRRLLIERQEKKEERRETMQITNADELAKYKDLLDRGIITQEEFEAKKKQLLEM